MMAVHIMTDIETPGKLAGCGIMQIAARVWEPMTGAMGPGFYTTISLVDCQKHGLTMDADTMLWWMGQSDDARKRVIDASRGKNIKTLAQGLSEYFNWVAAQSASPVMWANDPDFDYAIIEGAARAAGYTDKEFPWKFWDKVACRTVLRLVRMLGGRDMKKSVVFQGTPHYAPDDTDHQCRFISASIQTITGGAMPQPVQAERVVQAWAPQLPPLPQLPSSPIITCE